MLDMVDAAGKSVLMQVLCGRAPGLRCTGDVTLNGRAVDPHSQRNGFGYTPQEDLLIGDITVRYMHKTRAGAA
jgi:ABC-type multidrug transport system ATPase subunit